MPAVVELVSVQEQAAYLGLTSPDQATQASLALLIAGVTDLFQTACGRGSIPFQAAQAARIEVQDATGDAKLWLDYPPQTITAVKLGLDFTNPEETLDPANPLVLIWRPGDRCVQRVDGGLWSAGSGGALLSWSRGGPLTPENWSEPRGLVQITYDAQADQPARAKLAVMKVVAAWLNQKGAEGLKAEGRGARSFQYLTDVDPDWARAVESCFRTVAV